MLEGADVPAAIPIPLCFEAYCSILIYGMRRKVARDKQKNALLLSMTMSANAFPTVCVCSTSYAVHVAA